MDEGYFVNGKVWVHMKRQKELQRIKRVGICRTCAERLEWFITLTDTRGHGQGGNVSELVVQQIWMQNIQNILKALIFASKLADIAQACDSTALYICMCL